MHTRPKICPVQHTKQCWSKQRSANSFSVYAKPNSCPLQHIKQYWTKTANHSYCICTEYSTTCLKRKALFGKEESGGSCTVVKERLPGHLPFPDRFSIRVEEAICNNNILSVRRQLISDLGSFYYALSKHPLQGDYKRMALAVCDKFPDLRDSNPSSYWVCFLYIVYLLSLNQDLLWS